MSEAGEKFAGHGTVSRLAEALREVRNAAADREDVVVEMREAARTRLELLAQELEPVFAEVPDDEIQFDFAISSGLQPRLWIDATSHVAMGRDRRTYRFVKDTRLGRVVLAESTEMQPVVEQVTRYIAERLVERQRLMEGDVLPMLPRESARMAEAHESGESDKVWQAVRSTIWLCFLGALVGGAAAIAWFWDRLAPMVAG